MADIRRLHHLMAVACVGCGMCLRVCPWRAIRISVLRDRVTVSFDYRQCKGCSRCVLTCPAIYNLLSVNFKKAIEISVKSLLDIKAVYFGWSKDSNIRFNSASGGVVTAMLRYLLTKGGVDYVLVTSMENLIPRPMLTDSVDEILRSSGSIYFKTFTLQIVDKVLNLLRQGFRIAIVGLPCMIRAIKKYIPREYLVGNCLFIGLVCYHINEFWYLKYVLHRYSPSRDAKPISISSRKGEWPGSILITYLLPTTERKISVRVPQFSLWNIVPIFELTAPLGCLFCVDHLARDADIAVCDAWHPKFFNVDKLGVSLIIVRTDRGFKIIEELRRYGVIEILDTSLGSLILAQKRNAAIRVVQTFLRFAISRRPLSLLFALLKFPRIAFIELIRIMLLCLLKSRVISKFSRIRAAFLHVLEKLMYISKLHVIEEEMLMKVYWSKPSVLLKTLKDIILISSK